jgi:hypothetical protein
VGPVVGIEGNIRSMMDAGEMGIKERISMIRMTCSILKEEIKEYECAWSHDMIRVCCGSTQRAESRRRVGGLHGHQHLWPCLDPWARVSFG